MSTTTPQRNRAQERADEIKAERDQRAREHAEAHPDRNVDYVLEVAAPYAPLTRRGLRALSLEAVNGLEQLEALHVLSSRAVRRGAAQ